VTQQTVHRDAWIDIPDSATLPRDVEITIKPIADKIGFVPNVARLLAVTPAHFLGWWRQVVDAGAPPAPSWRLPGADGSAATSEGRWLRQPSLQPPTTGDRERHCWRCRWVRRSRLRVVRKLRWFNGPRRPGSRPSQDLLDIS
jgi:hypothetical protein